MAEKLIAVPESKLTDIADAIRLKRDMVESIPVDDMAMQIGLIESGGGELAVCTIDGYFTEDIPASSSQLNITPYFSNVIQNLQRFFSEIFGEYTEDKIFKPCIVSFEFEYLGEERTDIERYVAKTTASEILYVNLRPGSNNIVESFAISDRILKFNDGSLERNSTSGCYTLVIGSAGIDVATITARSFPMPLGPARITLKQLTKPF